MDRTRIARAVGGILVAGFLIVSAVVGANALVQPGSPASPVFANDATAVPTDGLGHDDASASPEATEAPEASDDPEGEPESTAKPAATHAPKATHAPASTHEPDEDDGDEDAHEDETGEHDGDHDQQGGGQHTPEPGDNDDNDAAPHG